MDPAQMFLRLWKKESQGDRKGREIVSERDRQTDRQTDIQIDRQWNRQIGE